MKKDTLVPALLAVAASALATSVLPVPVHQTKVQDARLLFLQLCYTASGACSWQYLPVL